MLSRDSAVVGAAALAFGRVDVRVCFFGDSFVAGVGDDEALGWVGRLVAQARADGVDLTGYNLGVRRQTGPEIAARLESEAAPRLRDGDVHGVVFSAGVNDTTIENGDRRVDPAASLAALASVADTCRSRPWALLVVGPAPVADRSQNDRIVALSAALGAACDTRQVPFVGLAPLLAGDGAWLDEVASGDGSHPSSRGYAAMAELIRPTFTEWLRSLTHPA